MNHSGKVLIWSVCLFILCICSCSCPTLAGGSSVQTVPQGQVIWQIRGSVTLTLGYMLPRTFDIELAMHAKCEPWALPSISLLFLSCQIVMLQFWNNWTTPAVVFGLYVTLTTYSGRRKKMVEIEYCCLCCAFVAMETQCCVRGLAGRRVILFVKSEPVYALEASRKPLRKS